MIDDVRVVHDDAGRRAVIIRCEPHETPIVTCKADPDGALVVRVELKDLGARAAAEAAAVAAAPRRLFPGERG